MKKFKIEFDSERCICCQACITACDNWIIDDNKVRPIKNEISENELRVNKDAEELCPVNVIKIRG